MYPSYAPYSPPSDASMLPYGHMQPYMPVTTLEPCPEYLPVTASAILPPMVSRMTDDGKGIFYAQDDPFAAGLNYGFVPGIHLDASHHHYDNPGSHVSSDQNPLPKPSKDDGSPTNPSFTLDSSFITVI